VLGEVTSDVAAARDRDPAARTAGTTEILLTWGGVQAILAHRVGHALHQGGVPFLPRLLAHASKVATGVEIHPAATIGPDCFIDHGSGVVIGETAEIGCCCTLYQGVTLGGTGFQRGKRHPSVEDNVTIGSGAKLLGPIRVGHGAKIGANTVVIEDVPANSTVVGNPGHTVKIEGRKVEGPDSDWIHLPDPIADAIRRLSERIGELERELGRDSDGRGASDESTGSPPAEPGGENVRELRPKRGPSTAGG
jgi:serine O-acetyltransferase